MLRKNVSSSNIDTVGYQRGQLFVRFNSGVTYSYDNVGYPVFKAIAEAESAGREFHKQVKGKYRYARLDTDPFTKTH